MDLPIRFPHEANVVYEEAVAYGRLSPTDRFLAILDLIASGVTLLNQSPHKEAALRLQQLQEAEWQRIQKGLFAAYAS